MSTMPGSGAARWVLAAVVIAAAAVTAACGTTHAGQGGGAAASPGAGSPATAATQCAATPAASAGQVSLSEQDNGKVLCVAKGTTVAIYLQGTATRRWAPISTESAALHPVANGHLMLKLGVTGAFFKAVNSGVATVVSSLPSCRGQAGGTAGTGGTGGTAGTGATSGPGCKMGTVFHLTLVVTP